MIDGSMVIKDLTNSITSLKVIHYACESWYTIQDRPVAISSISIVDFKNGDEISFSQSDFSDDPEKKLLERFYDHLRKFPDSRYVHWNMNSSDFGFEAIANRFRFLFKVEPPFQIPEERKFDLDDILEYKFGNMYIEHSKLYNMAIVNSFAKRNMLSGKEESEKFNLKAFGDIKRSVSEKAGLILFLLKRFLAGTIQTRNSGPLISWGGERIDALKIIFDVCNRFKYFSRQIGRRYGDRKTIEFNDEYDFQDGLHSVLTLFFDDIRREEWTPSYAGGANRIDFIIKDKLIAIELKHAKKDSKAKDFGDQIIIDIEKYKGYKDLKHLICIIFDFSGFLPNPRGIESDLVGVRDGVFYTTKIID
jgi:hypothetical protein